MFTDGYDALPGVFTLTPRSTEAVDKALATSVGGLVASRHHLRGEAAIDDAGTAVFGLQLDHGVSNAPTPTSPQLEIHVFADQQGVGLTLAARDGAWIACSWLCKGKAALDSLIARRRALVLFFRGRRLVAAFDASWDPLKDGADVLTSLLSIASAGMAMSFAGHWRGRHEQPSIWQSVLSIEDRAAAGWARGFAYLLEMYGEGLVPYLREKVRAAEPPTELPRPVQAAVADLRTDPGDERERLILWSLCNTACKEFRKHGLARLFTRDLDPVAAEVQSVLTLIASQGPDATDRGRSLSTIVPGQPGWVERIPLDLEAIERSIGFEEYWKRVSVLPRYLWHTFVKPDDIPASVAEVSQDLSTASLVEDVDDAEQTVSMLLQEAHSERRWCIPPDAVVDLRVGPFVRVHVREIGGAVAFMCRTRRGEFFPYLVVPEHGLFLVEPSGVGDAEVRRQIDMTMRVLLAAIVRDFWVTEDRTRAFARREEPGPRPKKRNGKAEPRGPIVVYLPRVRYEGRPDLARCARELAYAERRIHSVAAHLRRAAGASEHQRALASLHGWAVPEGFTFVRAHRRGAGEADVIYRSRSAQATLYEAAHPVDQMPTDDWFEFETAVREQLNARGLIQEQVRQLTGGRGIAIVARSSEREDALHLIHALRVDRVGPGVVNELSAALGNAPQGTRGVLMVTGAASIGALDAARSGAIDLVEHLTSAPR